MMTQTLTTFSGDAIFIIINIINGSSWDGYNVENCNKNHGKMVQIMTRWQETLSPLFQFEITLLLRWNTYYL